MEQNAQSNPFAALHKQKLYAVIAAGVGFIAMFLPWYKISLGGIFGMSSSINGLHGVGIIAFLGFVGAAVLSFLGDKTRPFEGQYKMLAAGCFAGAALFTLIQFISQTHFTSFGMWISLVAGIAGAVIVYVLKPEQLK